MADPQQNPQSTGSAAGQGTGQGTPPQSGVQAPPQTGGTQQPLAGQQPPAPPQTGMPPPPQGMPVGYYPYGMPMQGQPGMMPPQGGMPAQGMYPPMPPQPYPMYAPPAYPQQGGIGMAAPGMGGTQPAGGGAFGGQPGQQPQKLSNFRFGDWQKNFTTTIKIPAHNLKFDEAYFLKLLAGSISLTRDEKKRIIESVPKLRQQQIDELIRIFEEEKTKFLELSPKHGDQLEKLEKKHREDWRDLETMMVQANKKQEDTAKADEIRKKLGLA